MMAGIWLIIIAPLIITKGQTIVDRIYDDNANGASGWIRHMNGNNGVDRGITHDTDYRNGTYFIGPLSGGNTVGWWISKNFQCSEQAESMHMAMILYWCGSTTGDIMRLWMSGIIQVNAGWSDSNVPDGSLTGLEEVSLTTASSCSGWKYIKKDYSTNGVTGSSMMVQIEISLTAASEWAALSHIKVKCDYGPSKAPTKEPTNSPTTLEPTEVPTNQPTQDPTNDPTYQPTADPTTDPTAQPTIEPTWAVTYDPTVDPTEYPTSDPTIDPTTDPTRNPTKDPTKDPTRDPTGDPTSGDIMILPTLSPVGSGEEGVIIPSTTYSVNNATATEVNATSLNLQLIIYSVLGFFIILITISLIYSWFIKVNDFYRVTSLIAVAIHFNDALSDAFFCVDVSQQPNYPTNKLLFGILLLSVTFIIIPSTLTLYQLYKAINKWRRDDKLSQWLSKNTQLLYFISVITGSSFAAIELCTSNLFNLRYFDMPLSEAKLMEFKTKRIYSIVLLEVKSYVLHIVSSCTSVLNKTSRSLVILHAHLQKYAYCFYSEYPSIGRSSILHPTHSRRY